MHAVRYEPGGFLELMTVKQAPKCAAARARFLRDNRFIDFHTRAVFVEFCAFDLPPADAELSKDYSNQERVTMCMRYSVEFGQFGQVTPSVWTSGGKLEHPSHDRGFGSIIFFFALTFLHLHPFASQPLRCLWYLRTTTAEYPSRTDMI